MPQDRLPDLSGLIATDHAELDDGLDTSEVGLTLLAAGTLVVLAQAFAWENECFIWVGYKLMEELKVLLKIVWTRLDAV